MKQFVKFVSFVFHLIVCDPIVEWLGLSYSGVGSVPYETKKMQLEWLLQVWMETQLVLVGGS